MFLDHDPARAQLIRAEFLQVGHLTRSEKDLCFTKPVFVLVLHRYTHIEIVQFVWRELKKKTDTEKVNTCLERKTDIEKVNTCLERKTDTEKVNTCLERKTDTEKVNTCLERKTDTEIVRRRYKKTRHRDCAEKV